MPSWEFVTKSNQPISVFGIPLSVATWAAAGSLGAILYKFYTEKERVRFDQEVRWLIARPVIGIIMGAIVYLVIISGLLVLGSAPTPVTPSTSGSIQPLGRLEVYWVIAFLAGFSDKFYLRIINLLVVKTIGDETSSTVTVTKKIENNTQGQTAETSTQQVIQKTVELTNDNLNGNHPSKRA